MTQDIPIRKIFGIGLNKTGTTTLGKCGQILGYRCTSCNRDLLEDVVLEKEFKRLKEVVSNYDLFEDWPWPLVYKELDQFFPGSKFILTVRKDEKIWLNSLKKHSMRTHPSKHCRKMAYGFNYPHRHEKEHLELYLNHNENVRKYFADRDDDFIELCWENGDGFEKLCKFLGDDFPDSKLPHVNKGSNPKKQKIRFLTNKILSMLG